MDTCLQTDSWLAHFVATDSKPICHFHILYRHTDYIHGVECGKLQHNVDNKTALGHSVSSTKYQMKDLCLIWQEHMQTLGYNSTDFKRTCALNKEAKTHYARLPHHSKHKKVQRITAEVQKS